MPLTRPAFGCGADHLERGTDRLGVVQVDARHERVGVAAQRPCTSRNSCRCSRRRRASSRLMPLRCALRPQVLRVVVRAARTSPDPRSRCSSSGMFIARAFCSMRLAVAEQDRHRDAVVDADLRGADDLRLVALREHDALGIADRAIDQPAHDAARAAEPRLEPFAILVEVDELVRRARWPPRPTRPPARPRAARAGRTGRESDTRRRTARRAGRRAPRRCPARLPWRAARARASPPSSFPR